jgi:hypothetical protein
MESKNTGYIRNLGKKTFSNLICPVNVGAGAAKSRKGKHYTC